MHAKFTPKYLQRWKRPSCYIGAKWPEYFVFLYQSRDSDCLERSNFRVAYARLWDKPHEVFIVREAHWALGWVEWIAIHENDEPNLRLADQILEELEDYPVLDESDLSKME